MTIAIALDSVNGQPATQGQPAVLTVGALNSFTLRLTNTGAALPLTGGTPIAKGDPADKPSSIYLEFAADTFADFKSFDLTPPVGWSCLPFDKPFPMWALAPKDDRSWDAGAGLTVAVAKVQVLSRNGQGILPVDVTRVAGLRGAGKSLPILTQSPGLKDLRDTIDFDFDSSNQVFISDSESRPLVNTLLFHISNTNPNRPVGILSWPPNNPPTFSLTFATAEATDPDAAGALTTAALADGIALSDPTVYQDGWKRLDRPHGDLTWKMQPLTQEILGTEAASSVQFAITGIKTFLPEGLTWTYLIYTHVPGYADGYFAKPLRKKTAIPQVQRFINLTPNIIEAGDPVQLAWQTFDAAGLALSYRVEGRTQTLWTPNDIALNADSYTPLPAPAHSTTYYLDVLDETGRPIPSCRPPSVNITVNPYKTKINSFTANPAGWVFDNKTAVPIAITWSVEHGRQIQLTNAELNLVVTRPPDQNTWSGNIHGPTTFHLQALGEDGTWQSADLPIIDLRDFISGKTLKLFVAKFPNDPYSQYTFNPDGHGRVNIIYPGPYDFEWEISGDQLRIVEHPPALIGVETPVRYQYTLRFANNRHELSCDHFTQNVMGTEMTFPGNNVVLAQ
jgi:hypothetical protein